MSRVRAVLTAALAVLGGAVGAAPARAGIVTLPVQVPAGTTGVSSPVAGPDGTLWTVPFFAPLETVFRVDPRTGAVVGSFPLGGIAPDPPGSTSVARTNVVRTDTARRGPDGALYALTAGNPRQIVRLTAGGGAVVPPAAGVPDAGVIVPTSAGFYVSNVLGPTIQLIRDGVVVHQYRSTSGLPIFGAAPTMVAGPGGTLWMAANTTRQGQIAILSPSGSVRRLRTAPGSAGPIRSLALVGRRWWFIQATRRRRMGVWTLTSGSTPRLACELPRSVRVTEPLTADLNAPRGRLYGGDRDRLAILDTRRGTFASVANPTHASPSGDLGRSTVTGDGSLWIGNAAAPAFTRMTPDTTGRVLCHFDPPR